MAKKKTTKGPAEVMAELEARIYETLARKQAERRPKKG